MAPHYNIASASAERRNTALLDKYLCRVCQAWKPSAHYSNRELANYTNNHAKGNRVDGVTAKLRCRVCAGGGITELLCEGSCGRKKSLDHFSKTSRKAGGNKWCKECTFWKESQEHDLTSTAPPEAELAPDEDGGFFPGERMNSFYDVEAGNGEESDDDYDYTGSSTAWGTSDARSHAAHSTTSNANSSQDMLTASFVNLTVSGQSVEAPSMSSSAPGWIAPHLRIPPSRSSGQPSGANEPQATLSSNPNAAADQRQAVPAAEWTAVDARRRPAAFVANPIRFNAWDNAGQKHAQQRYPSSSERTFSDSSSVVSAAPISTMRAQHISTSSIRPANGPTNVNVQRAARNSNWAKPIGNRTQGPQYQPSRPSTAPNHAVDSDSDDDYM